MDFEYYKFIMKKQFKLLQGMYLDQCSENDGYTFFKSNIISDNYWNFAANVTYQDLCKDGLLSDIEDTFRQADRMPCIYIPDFMKDSDLIQEFLFSNGYKKRDLDSFMFFRDWNIQINIQNEVKEVQDREGLKAFIDVLNDAFGGEPSEENPYGGAVDESYEKALEKSLDNNEKKFHHMVLFEGSIPVSVATLTYKDGYGGIYSVGTKTEYHNRGYGKQIMKACVDKFYELGGGELLISTEKDSKNEVWYKKLGFETKFINEQYVKVNN